MMEAPVVVHGETTAPSSYRDILHALTVALARVAPSSDRVIPDSWAVLEQQYRKGRIDGMKQASDEAFNRGYQQGLQDGYAEAIAEKIINSIRSKS